MHPLLRLMRFVRPYRTSVVVGSICLLLSIPCSLFQPLVWKFVVDDVVLGKEYGLLLPALGVMLAVHLLGTALGMVRTLLLGKAGERFIFDLRNAVYSKLQQQGLGYFHRRRSGDIVARVMGDVDAVRYVVVDGIDEIFSSLVSFVLVAGIIVYLHPIIGALTLLPIVGVALLILVFNKRVKALYRRIRDRLGDVTAKLSENLQGVAVIKGFSRENFEQERFREAGETYLEDSLKGVKVRALYMPSVMSVGFLSNIAMIGLGGYFVIQGSFTLGGLVAYRGYWWQLFAPVYALARINEMWQRANAAAARIVEVLDEPDLVADRPDAVELGRVRGAIEFDAVSFSYEAGRPALRNISFQVRAGQSVGIVGASGAGKSTIINLLLRFYDPQSGAIRLDGRELRAVTQRSLRDQFAVVAQDAFLFHESIMDNIRYGKLDATPEEVEHAARLANAHEFIDDLPKGYHTVVGERGFKLSGGQRQRICIARAFLKDPAVLLLDEATASVEPESERIIAAALSRLMENRTTIVVSHRLSMVRDTDNILVIADGRLGEQGDHASLMRRGGWYASMYRLQMGEGEGREPVLGRTSEPSTTLDVPELSRVGPS